MRNTLAAFTLLVLTAIAAQAQDGTRVRTAMIRGMELPYEIVDGLAVHAGDIILGTAEEVARRSAEYPLSASARPTLVTQAVPSGYAPSGLFCIWPDGIIPYVIENDVPEQPRNEVLKAIRVWDTQTVLQFVERTPQHEDYVRFTPGPWSGTWICGEGVQDVVVGPWESVSNMVHTIGHVIGMAHENQRRDRDRWLRVFSDNISRAPLARGAWHPSLGYGRDIGPYDYRSVMHYGFLEPLKQRNHARPYQAETIPPGMPFAYDYYDESKLSLGDVDSTARMYGHIPSEHVVSTNPPGLEIIVDGERMTAPASFTWATGSQHTLEVPSPQSRDGARFLFGRWNDDGARAHTVTATDDTTLYEANFISQHKVSTRVTCGGGASLPACGSITIRPASPDGYYTLRTPIEVEATSSGQSRFEGWYVSTFQNWILEEAMHGGAANPARSFALPSMIWEAFFTDGPLVRVESNVDPVPVVFDDDGWRRFTPLHRTPDQVAGRTVTARLLESPGRGYRHRFRSWSDGGDLTHTIEVPRDADTTLTLTLDTEYRLTTHAWHGNHGNEILTTPPSADGFYPEGTEVRLLASARPPAKFIGWNGDVAGRDPSALVVMNDGKLAEAVFAVEATALQSGVPVEVSLEGSAWGGSVPDFGRYYIELPPDASEIEVEFYTRVAVGGEAGLFVAADELWPTWVRQDTADLVLRAGEVATVTVRRPPTRWPAAYFILVRGAESDSWQTQTLQGTLVARVKRYGDGNRLVGGQRLRPGQFIQARAEACRLVFQTDGNFVAYKNRVAYWSARTRGAGGGSAAMQSDGNFVVYGAEGAARWSTRTSGNTGAFLVIQNDCNVVLRTAGGVALWSSGRP